MNREFRDQWVAALRSGKYRQGRGKLRTADNKFCCLGVACDIARKLGKGKWEREDQNYSYSYPSYGYPSSDSWDTLVPPALRGEIGLELGAESTLVDVNDGGASFEEIADWIERNL